MQYAEKLQIILQKDTCTRLWFLKIKLLKDSRLAIAPGYTKLRTDKCLIVGIYALKAMHGSLAFTTPMEEAYSCVYPDARFPYIVGTVATEIEFNEDLALTCVPGIHFCYSLEAAIDFHHSITYDRIINTEDMLNLKEEQKVVVLDDSWGDWSDEVPDNFDRESDPEEYLHNEREDNM